MMHTSASHSKKPVGVFFTSKKILLMYLKKKRCSGSPSCSKQNALKDHIEKKCFSTSKSSPKKDRKKSKMLMICCSFSLNYSHYLLPLSIEQNWTELHDAALSCGLSTEELPWWLAGLQFGNYRLRGDARGESREGSTVPSVDWSLATDLRQTLQQTLAHANNRFQPGASSQALILKDFGYFFFYYYFVSLP